MADQQLSPTDIIVRRALENWYIIHQSKQKIADATADHDNAVAELNEAHRVFEKAQIDLHALMEAEYNRQMAEAVAPSEQPPLPPDGESFNSTTKERRVTVRGFILEALQQAEEEWLSVESLSSLYKERFGREVRPGTLEETLRRLRNGGRIERLPSGEYRLAATLYTGGSNVR